MIFSIKYTDIPVIQVTTGGANDTDFGRANLGQVIGTKDGFSCDANFGNIEKVRIYWIAIGY